MGAAGVLHFGLAHVLLTLLHEGGPPGVPHGREVVSLAVTSTRDLEQLIAGLQPGPLGRAAARVGLRAALR